MAKMAGALAALASGEDAKGINTASNTAAIAAENNATSLQQKAVAMLVAGEAAVVAIESVAVAGGGTAAVGGTVCAASGVCALVVGTVFIAGVAYAVIASDNKADIEGFSVAGAQPPLPGFEPTKTKGFVDQGVAVNDSKPDVEGFNAVDPYAGTKDEGFSILPDWAKNFGSALFNDNKSNQIVLGHHPAYTDEAAKTGAQTFEVPINIWKPMSEEQKWEANVKFLDRAIQRGDEIVLATPPDQARNDSYYRKELDYLQSKGYVPSADGKKLIKE
jgi:hypothetical protein